MKLLFLFVTALLLSACAVEPLQAWDRGYLARPEMAWDPDSLSASQRNHVYFSKEASSGAASAGGGGCGCN
ncbi:hypothetical protein HNQ57_000181 [Zhongshania antarctica]|uniref:DUF4266 domain-containing protein n=1 Tax=Zhongshania antarctica TaxID=641702 RepID=A0A840R0A7_9GAMM|nr:DUF4266 domain-containing protein [Zhongshania antarctica]MBB5185922.1 hypothetical protein [Zhongshania antarctica]